MSSLDQQDSAVSTTKNLVKEITDNLGVALAQLRNNTIKAKEQHNSSNRIIQEERIKLAKKYEESKTLNKELINQRDNLHKLLDKDLKEISAMEQNNKDFINRVKELEIINRALNDKKEELQSKLNEDNHKLELLREKHNHKAKEQKSTNAIFRKYLGLDIARIRDNCLKITFYNLENECYLMIDFNQKECVSECYPELNLDKLNHVFKEGKCFYKFMKYVREEFKNKL